MGEFHDAVSTLLEAFGRGIDIIKSQRGRRKREQLPIEPAKKNAESHLSKSLKENRLDVEKAYGRDLARHGHGFAVGDGKTFLLCAIFLLGLETFMNPEIGNLVFSLDTVNPVSSVGSIYRC
jgi:hypothetical protein